MSDAESKQTWKERYEAAFEAVARVQARELKAMTDEEALRQIESLSVTETPWRENREWSGLVEQQAIFHKRKPA